ncbi:ABC transporter permease subunit [Phytohabitans houttuyneae]|uniref:DUF1349 domain-containing protein n=1 Tax=Phytohabitans houttuyneae TaxID=1076126 RepID=A0A6V8K2V6_9ACTN|nr:ABC transporter permease subunit [Phytohabitans houttuyneae]GFJ76117.1 hypothetical protein Phou_002970 [Phytohabitans houttuyneae]
MRPLRAELTKLRTAPGLVWCLVGAAAVMLALPLLASAGNPGTYDRAAYVDEFRFVHRTLSGDGTLTARVRTPAAGHPWAMTGLMVKQSASPGARYAAVFVTPGHGTRMQADFTVDIAGGGAASWLRIARTGDTVTGYASADGATWREVGRVPMAGLPASVEIGLFATSPGITRTVATRPVLVPTRPATALFDSVSPAGEWRGTDVGLPSGRSTVEARDVLSVTAQPGGVLSVTAQPGDILARADDGSRVVAATAGTFAGMLPLVALGALVMTSEYRRHLVRTTLAASPRRGPVLAAKALVAGGACFAAALVATAAALLLAQPLLRRNGYRPPTYPDPSLGDPRVLRVVAGTAAAAALVALLGLGAGAILRRGAAAITAVAAVLLVPAVLTPLLPAGAGTWVQRLTPVAGLSVQQVRETDDAFLLPWAGRPWAGLAVLAAWAAAALAVAYLLLSRRDA